MTAKIGEKYEIECGWGLTKAALTAIYDYGNRKQYHWEDVDTHFKFISWDLKNTKKHGMKSS